MYWMAAMDSLEAKWKKLLLSVSFWDEGGRRTEGYILQVGSRTAHWSGEPTPAPSIADQLRDLGGNNCGPQWKAQGHKVV